jgi:hypothetical protein
MQPDRPAAERCRHQVAHSLVLHAPALNRPLLDYAEKEVLDCKTDEDHCQQPGKYFGNLDEVLVLENVPTQSAGPGGNPEDQLGSNEGAPSERLADFQAGENTGKCRREQDLADERNATQAVIATDHPHGVGNCPETGMRIQCDRPQHGVN